MSHVGLHTYGAVHATLTYSEMTGYAVTISSHGSSLDGRHAFQYLRNDHLQTDLYNAVSEFVGQWVDAFVTAAVSDRVD